MTQLEVAITTLDEAIAAQAGGADSVEVCYDLRQHGLTPDLSLVKAIIRALSIDVHVIIRPHGRDFIYKPLEVEVILAQVAQFAALDIAGLVFGAQQADSRLDVALIKQVAGAAGAKPLTLHRALDSCANPEEALSQLNGLVPRVLTSGPAKSAWLGRHDLGRWVAQFGTQMRFVAAGGITLQMLPQLVKDSGAAVVHVGSAARADGVVSAERVKTLKIALQSSL